MSLPTRSLLLALHRIWINLSYWAQQRRSRIGHRECLGSDIDLGCCVYLTANQSLHPLPWRRRYACVVPTEINQPQDQQNTLGRVYAAPELEGEWNRIYLFSYAELCVTVFGQILRRCPLLDRLSLWLIDWLWLIDCSKLTYSGVLSAQVSFPRLSWFYLRIYFSLLNIQRMSAA